jgi:hypothetical protein
MSRSLTDGFGDSWNRPNVEIDEKEVKRRARERREQIEYEVQCRIQENDQFAVESYTRLFGMEVWERPENWWKIDWVASAM